MVLPQKVYLQFVCGMEASPPISPLSTNHNCIEDHRSLNTDNESYVPFQGDDRDLKTIPIVFHIMQQSNNLDFGRNVGEHFNSK